MACKGFSIRSYKEERDRGEVEDLERRCEVGPANEHVLFTNTMGDPICRIRNSPMFNMLVAELENEIVGVIQGSIKVVSLHRQSKELAKVGYILGLRVSPLQRHKGIASSLVQHLEQWFISNQVDYAYVATQKNNRPSVNLFINKLGFVKFRTPAILVFPVNKNSFRLSSYKVEISKVKIEQAEFLYRKFMGSSDFFPYDIDRVLGNKLCLGTWVAYPRGQSGGEFRIEGQATPNSWGMLSVWNSGEVFKLSMGKSTLTCFLYEMYSRFLDRVFPCFKVPEMPDLGDPFGFYFVFGVYHEGPLGGNLIRTLCKFVHNMATKTQDCKVMVTEIGGGDGVKLHIPHWKFLSCPEDLWCIKPLKKEERNILHELTKTSPKRPLFVDPREV